MKRLTIFILLLLTAHVQADLHLNGLFTDNMVLQRGQTVPVWGTADVGATITVEMAGQSVATKTNVNGSWTVHLKPMQTSSDPTTLTVRSSRGNQALTIKNVLVGDVWLCAGQSNMASMMKSYLLWDSVEDDFSNEQIRLFKIQQGGVGSPEPTKELVIDPFFEDSWQTCSPKFAAEFSATGAFFGMKLQRDTNVPIGLLYANRGGTEANMWLPRTVLEANPDYARFLDASNANWKPSTRNPDAIRAPSHLFNGTIYPLAPFAIRGVIWYQGESDARWPELYEELFTDVIESWRKLWGYDFPFLFVQLAPYDNVGWDQTDEAWAWLRDAQTQVAKNVPHSAMAVITDAGEAMDIHPQAKNLPGERLASLAAKLDNPKVEAASPTYKNLTIEGDKAIIEFANVTGGLKTQRVAMNLAKGRLPGEGPDAIVVSESQLEGFLICGADRKFVKAQARIVSPNMVEVHAPSVKKPVAIRYAWANFPLCNLYGGNGDPADPFRTDNYPMPNLTQDRRGLPFRGTAPQWGEPMKIFEVDDGTFEVIKVRDRDAWKTTSRYLYFKSPSEGQSQRCQVRVIYHDKGFTPIHLLYDSTSSEIFAGKVPGVWKNAGAIRLSNSGQWKVATFELFDARFAGRCNGADIRLHSQALPAIHGGYYSKYNKSD